MAHVPNCTDTVPVIQISSVLVVSIPERRPHPHPCPLPRGEREPRHHLSLAGDGYSSPLSLRERASFKFPLPQGEG